MGLLATLERLVPALYRAWPVEATRKFTRLLREIDIVDEFCRERDRLKIPTV